MIDHYFNEYDNIILPIKHSKSTTNQHVTQLIIPNQNKMSNNESTIQCMTSRNRNAVTIQQDDAMKEKIKERKMNMFLRQENIYLKKQIDKQQKDITKLTNEIEQYKNNKENDNEYVIKLEKLVNYLERNNNCHKKTQSSIPKQINLNLEINENMQSHKIEKDNDNEMKRLEKENKQLYTFKEEIFKISKQYDEFNSNIIDFIMQFGDIIKDFNNKLIFEIPFDSPIEIKYLNEGKKQIDNVLQTIVKYMKTKQEEYNYLLDVKENDHQSIINQLKELEVNNISLINILNEKNSQLKDLNDQITKPTTLEEIIPTRINKSTSKSIQSRNRKLLNLNSLIQSSSHISKKTITNETTSKTKSKTKTLSSLDYQLYPLQYTVKNIINQTECYNKINKI